MNFKIYDKEFCVDKKVVGISVIIIIMLVIIGNYFYDSQAASNNDIVLSNISKTPLSTGTTNSSLDNSNDSQNNKPSNEINVDVRGSVKNPGIIKLIKGQMINDAIEKAGGFTDDADIDNINLVYILNENVLIKINPKGYIDNTKEQHTTGTNKVNYAGNGVEISKETGGVLYEKNSGDSSNSNLIININTANEKELETLSGIGPKKAADIIKFREQNGSFKLIENIKDVSGIGEAAFNKIKEFITI